MAVSLCKGIVNAVEAVSWECFSTLKKIYKKIKKLKKKFHDLYFF